MPSEVVSDMPRMSKDEYFASPGLSQSGIKDLMVSPLRFWFKNVDPNRIPEEPTPERIFGNAVHAAVLEPEAFESRYARKVDVEDFNGCLVTVPEMRAYMEENNQKLKGTLKADIIKQVQAFNPNVPILDIELAKAEALNSGKTVLAREDWNRVQGCSIALRDEPVLCGILEQKEAESEVAIMREEDGVLLKGCLDWLWPGGFLDVKTFQQKRAVSIDKSVADAIWFESYYRQVYFYAKLLGWPQTWNGQMVMAFVESTPPHDVRIKSFHPKVGGQANLYWQRAAMEVRSAIASYKDWSINFGERPWREVRDISPLQDDEIKQLAYD